MKKNILVVKYATVALTALAVTIIGIGNVSASSIPIEYDTQSQSNSFTTSSATVTLSTSSAQPWQVLPAEISARKARNQKVHEEWNKLPPIEQARRSSGIKGSRKIAVSPVKQADGIKTGLVIAYGHIIPPPYKIETDGRNLLINGVQVDPSLVGERERKKQSGLHSPMSPEQAKQYRRQDEVDSQVLAIYRAGAGKKPMEQVRTEILELLRKSTDVYLNPGVSDKGYGGEIAGSGGLQFSMPLTLADSPKVPDSVIKARASEARKDTVSMFSMDLKNGACIVFVSDGYTIGVNKSRLGNVYDIMQEPGLSNDDRIEKLKTQVFNNYEASFQIVENYRPEEWKDFKVTGK